MTPLARALLKGTASDTDCVAQGDDTLRFRRDTMSTTNKTENAASTRTLALRKETVRSVRVHTGVKAGARSTTLRCNTGTCGTATTCVC